MKRIMLTLWPCDEFSAAFLSMSISWAPVPFANYLKEVSKESLYNCRKPVLLLHL